MKYIGPFLRMNTLSLSNLENQLFFFSKEALKHLVLKSRCGITMHPKVVKKNIPNIDINIIKDFSPLLCIYKKANPKIIKEKDYAYWDSATFKKEVVPSSCAYMTLSLLELVDYYDKFKETDTSLYTLSILYKNMAKHQLDFYTSYLRNAEGVFIIRKNISEDSSDKIVFEDKENKFKFSEQAAMMTAFYKYYMLIGEKDGAIYGRFAEDIFNMLLHYRDNLYGLSFEELNKIALSLNLYFTQSKNLQTEHLLLDILELMNGKLNESSRIKEKLNHLSLFIINLSLSYDSCGMEALRERRDELLGELLELYDEEKRLITNKSDKKEIKFTAEDIVYYMLSLISYSSMDKDQEEILKNVYKNQLLGSKLITSWPETPSLDCPERYLGFKISSDNLLEEQNFKMPAAGVFETDCAPIFLKAVEYNSKKETFTQGKLSFDSTKNLPLIFMFLFLLKGKYFKNCRL